MKEYAEVSHEVRNLIADSLKIPPETVDNTSVIEDLSADSIQLFELLLAFESTYLLKTSYDDVVRMRTVDDVVRYIHVNKYSVPA